ncbi:MAG: hypothetical protein IPN77_09430 [Sandaracinaceae bacterium]|nr:hypothetical protein [Sandaracinaceae bacterium]
MDVGTGVNVNRLEFAPDLSACPPARAGDGQPIDREALLASVCCSPSGA